MSIVRAVVEDTALLRKALTVAGDLVDVANLDVAEDGMSLQSMDTSHVCLVALDVARNYFETYELVRPASLGVKLSHLNKVMSCTSGSSQISADDDVLEVSSETSNFKLRLIDVESERMGVPEEYSTVSLEMDAAAFQRIVKDLSMFGDVATMTADSEGVHMSVSGDIGDATVLLAGADVRMQSPAKASFALRYLNTFAKSSSVSSRVQIGLTQDMPLVLKYVFGEGSSLAFYLAPKIDDDDESA